MTNTYFKCTYVLYVKQGEDVPRELTVLEIGSYVGKHLGSLSAKLNDIHKKDHIDLRFRSGDLTTKYIDVRRGKAVFSKEDI